MKRRGIVNGPRDSAVTGFGVAADHVGTEETTWAVNEGTYVDCTFGLDPSCHHGQVNLEGSSASLFGGGCRTILVLLPSPARI